MTTTAETKLIDRRVRYGNRRDETAALLAELLTETAKSGDETLIAALVYHDFATLKQAEKFVADRSRVWIDEGGVVACDQHGGAYLTAAVTAHPNRRQHTTRAVTGSATTAETSPARPATRCTSDNNKPPPHKVIPGP